MDLLKNILLVWAQYREFRATLAELNGYSDRELAEAGIARSDIAQVAYEKAERYVMAPVASGRVPAPAWQDPVLVSRR
jgi:uncharacterized protein YjiS (DUF1127 family)